MYSNTSPGQRYSPDDLMPEEEYGARHFLWELVKVALLAVVVIVPIRVFLFQPFFVQGSSMEPNFEDGEYLIVGEMGYKKTIVGVGGKHLFTVEPFKEFQRQEVLVFRPPHNEDQFFIKRVIGLPGENVQLKNSKITIRNEQFPGGFTLDESAYLASSVPTQGDISIQLRDDEYFVMGDNRSFSHDSRSFGPVKKDHVIGDVLVRAWPIDRVQLY